MGHVAVLSYKENNGFEDSPQASCPRKVGGNGCEDPLSELHTCVKGEVV
jgi:hypothetical protein